jgi:hypothetical protein
MGRLPNRWGDLRKRRGNAHSLALAAPAIAFQVAKWRAELPANGKAKPRELDVERLRRALHRAESLQVDPYLVAFVVMGAEWLFRARPFEPEDIAASLDQLEAKLRAVGIGDVMPWEASLLVGGIYPGVLKGLRRGRYLVALGRWAVPARGWREVVAGQLADKKRSPGREPGPSRKRGSIPELGPIVVGLLVDAFAARSVQPGGGGRALAMELASILRGRRIQSGDFGTLLRAASGPPPDKITGFPNECPADLRGWLASRWESAYRICFDEGKRYWSSFLVEAATNPLALFKPLADQDVVNQLYDVAWWHDLSPRRKSMAGKTPSPASKKGR